jgi:hypothetical protein
MFFLSFERFFRTEVLSAYGSTRLNWRGLKQNHRSVIALK